MQTIRCPIVSRKGVLMQGWCWKAPENVQHSEVFPPQMIYTSGSIRLVLERHQTVEETVTLSLTVA
jgi:hypothetical protein